MKKILFWIPLFLLQAGCIEYRWEGHNKIPERYFSTPWTDLSRKDQDPKLGSKAKLYLNNNGTLRAYIGGHYSTTRLTGNLGVIYYPSRKVSFELGYRSFLLELNDNYSDNTTKVTWYNDERMENMFYIGGKIRF